MDGSSPRAPVDRTSSTGGDVGEGSQRYIRRCSPEQARQGRRIDSALVQYVEAMCNRLPLVAREKAGAGRCGPSLPAVGGWLVEAASHCAGLTGEIFDIGAGKTMSAAAGAGDDKVPFLRTSNVFWDRLDLSSLDEMSISDAELEEKKLSRYLSDELKCQSRRRNEPFVRRTCGQAGRPEAARTYRWRYPSSGQEVMLR